MPEPVLIHSCSLLGIFGRAREVVTFAEVPIVKVTEPLVAEEVRVTAEVLPPPVHVVLSPPLAVVLVCWQVSETVPV